MGTVFQVYVLASLKGESAMKKAIVLFGVLVLSVFLIPSPAQAQVTFGFKLTGGLGYYGAGDLNTGL
jgi:hypothetical protein